MGSFPKAFVFDVFGTLVDWRYWLTKGLVEAAQTALQTKTPMSPNPSTRRRAAEMTWTHWEAFAVEWHGKYIAFAAGFMPGISAWLGCDELQLRSLKVLLEEKGIESLWSEQSKRSVASLWYQLEAWPDTAPGITILNSLGAVTSTLSNGSKQNLRELAERNAIPFGVVLSSEDFRAYKPHRRTYTGAIQSLSKHPRFNDSGIQPHEVAMVASHLGDLRAAKSHGMQTIYIERPLEEKMTAKEVEEMRGSGLIDLWIEDRAYEMGASGLRAMVEVLSETYDHYHEESL